MALQRSRLVKLDLALHTCQSFHLIVRVGDDWRTSGVFKYNSILLELRLLCLCLTASMERTLTTNFFEDTLDRLRSARSWVGQSPNLAKR